MVIDDGAVETTADGAGDSAGVLGFEEFFTMAEPKLRRALVARHGIEHGREATIDALTYGWRHWERVGAMENSLGYLYRVGATSVRRSPVMIELDQHGETSGIGYDDPWVEPALEAGLSRLSEHQRVAAVLRHSFEWTYDEIAELLDISVSSVRNHLERAMSKLRDALEVDDG